MRRSATIRYLITVAVAAMALVPAGSGPAEAHSKEDFYSATLQTTNRECSFLGVFSCSNVPRDQEFWLAEGFVHTSTERTRIREALNDLSALPTNQHLNFIYRGTRNTIWTSCSDSNKFHYGMWDNLGDKYLGQASWCVNGSRVTAFRVRWSTYYRSTVPPGQVNEGYRFYYGTGTPAWNEFTFKGTVLHEIIHGTGWAGHFTAGWRDILCTSSMPRHVMCSAIRSGHPTHWMQDHDRHTIQNAYA